MADYVKWIRSKVGHDTVIFSASAACITNEAGDILLQKRSKNEELWGLPGGILEIGDSAEGCIIREVKEETGLDVKVEHLVGLYSKYFYTYPSGDHAQTVCYCFKCTAFSGDLNIDNEETFDLRFFDRTNIPKLFNKQHNDMLIDFLENKTGVFK